MIMSKINYDMVEHFLSNFSGDSIPIRFIDHIYIIYKDGSEKHIDGDKIRQLFPHITHTTHGVLKDHHDIDSLEIRIDKSRVFKYLLEIEKEIKDIISNTMISLRRKGRSNSDV